MKKENKKVILFGLFPLLIIIEIIIITSILSLVSQPSDMAVFAGITVLCGLIIANLFLGEYIIKFLKTKKEEKK